MIHRPLPAPPLTAGDRSPAKAYFFAGLRRRNAASPTPIPSAASAPDRPPSPTEHPAHPPPRVTVFTVLPSGQKNTESPAPWRWRHASVSPLAFFASLHSVKAAASAGLDP